MISTQNSEILIYRINEDDSIFKEAHFKSPDTRNQKHLTTIPINVLHDTSSKYTAKCSIHGCINSNSSKHFYNVSRSGFPGFDLPSQIDYPAQRSQWMDFIKKVCNRHASN